MKLSNITISVALLSLYSLSTLAEKPEPNTCLHTTDVLVLTPIVSTCQTPGPCKPQDHKQRYLLLKNGVPIAIVPRANPHTNLQ